MSGTGGENPNNFSLCQHFKAKVFLILPTFKTDGPLKARILLFPPIPIYVNTKHRRISTAKLKLPLSLPLINNFDFWSLLVDFRFCYCYNTFKNKQNHPFHCLLYFCKLCLCFFSLPVHVHVSCLLCKCSFKALDLW